MERLRPTLSAQRPALNRVNYPDQVAGQLLGLHFPSNPEALRAGGAEFLTTAFRASGAIGNDNRVTAVTGFEEFFGGGAGRKLVLSVAYEKPDNLHTELFVKYPRDFGDPLRDLFAGLMEPETRFALFSRRPDFPVAVPKCYFADYDPQSRTGVLVTERIRYGTAPIEPFRDKCLDYELPDPLGHYRALLEAIARLAGVQRSGRFGAEFERAFPFDTSRTREHDRIPYSAEQLAEKIANIGRFGQRYPRLLPAHLCSAEFVSRFAAEAREFLEHEQVIKRFLNSRQDFIALCHWNANVDNAWFWRNARGELEAGLLDWGSVSQMNVAQSIFGVLCAVEPDFWSRHCEELIRFFAGQYRRYGGPHLETHELRLHVQLFVAMLGLAWMIDAPSIIVAQLPQLSVTADRFDAELRGNFLARAQLHLLTVFLHAWQLEDFGAVLRRFLARSDATLNPATSDTPVERRPA